MAYKKRVPNMELLKDAYAILGGIPDSVLNLNTIRTDKPTPEVPECGSICCGMGWLAQHPDFNKVGLSMNAEHTLTYKNHQVSYTTAAGRLFGVTDSEAESMFGMFYGMGQQSHKKVLLDRIMKVLVKHDAVKNHST